MKRYLFFFGLALFCHALLVLPFVDWIQTQLAAVGGGSGASIRIAIQTLPAAQQNGLRASQSQAASKSSNGHDRQQAGTAGAGRGPAHGPTVGAGSSRRGNDQLLAEIRALIEAAKHYPLMARRRGLEGTSSVSFHINEDGSIAQLTLRHSSGSAILDDAALKTIERAAPFPAYPEPIQIGIRFALGETPGM